MVTVTHTYGRTGSGDTPANPVLIVATYDDLPSPDTRSLGDLAFVHSDANDSLNGLHGVHAGYWKKT